jgi:hypothetical protein
VFVAASLPALANVFSTVRGIVHDAADGGEDVGQCGQRCSHKHSRCQGRRDAHERINLRNRGGPKENSARDYSGFDSALYRILGAKWHFSQENATSHALQMATFESKPL